MKISSSITAISTETGSLLTWQGSWNAPEGKDNESKEFEKTFTSVMGSALKNLSK